jgi:O6-methylguanine-DNA--protein-cysteine methyltransferase
MKAAVEQNELEYGVFNTRLGWMAAAASDKGLVALTLPQKSAKGALALLGDAVNSRRRDERFTGLVGQLEAYGRGKNVDFVQTLDLSAATPFQRRVWLQTQKYPSARLAAMAGWPSS